ncbi:SDR family oxidoreductase [Nocardia tengchongensis]|uniref:SDR family oxidoreductase n=1 Tax=Nocardia tengchongensis TaxID=2055889 RepID=UPI00367DC67F
MSTLDNTTAAVIAPPGNEVANAIATEMRQQGCHVTLATAGDASPAEFDAVVFVTGSPCEYNIAVSDISRYVGEILADAAIAVRLLPTDGLASRSLVLVAPPVGAIFESGATAISTVGGALQGLSRALTVELGEYGIRSNVVQPGIYEAAIKRASVIPTIPLERTEGLFTQPLDIARAAVFLASDDASYISGAIVDVDGGLSEDRHAIASVLWAEGITTADESWTEALLGHH